MLNQDLPFLTLILLIESALDASLRGRSTGSDVERLAVQCAEAARFDALTAAEQDVLRVLARGASASGIAASSHRSLTTVRSHIKAVLAKLQVTSQVAAVAVAHRVAPTAWFDVSGEANPQLW